MSPKRVSLHYKNRVESLLNGLSWIIPHAPKLFSVLSHQNNGLTQTPQGEFGNYFVSVTKQRNTWGNTKKILLRNPPEQTKKITSKRNGDHDVAPWRPPDTTEPCLGTVGVQEGRASIWLSIWGHSCMFLCTHIYEKVLERTAWRWGRLQLKVPIQSFPPGLFSLLEENETVFPLCNSVRHILLHFKIMCHPSPNVDAHLEIFKLKNNIIMLLSCLLC